MKKIMLIGSGGSGKSTLARKLGEKLMIDVHHLDALLWKPNWVAVSKEEQKRIQQELVKKKEWIIDGNYGGTMEIRLQAADTIIFLDIHRTICIYRTLKRMWTYRNKTRPDMREGCNERFDLPFLKWIWQYPELKRPEINKRLQELSEEKTVFIIKSPKEVRNFIDQIANENL